MPCFAGLFGEGGHGRAQAGAAQISPVLHGEG